MVAVFTFCLTQGKKQLAVFLSYGYLSLASPSAQHPGQLPSLWTHRTSSAWNIQICYLQLIFQWQLSALKKIAHRKYFSWWIQLFFMQHFQICKMLKPLIAANVKFRNCYCHIICESKLWCHISHHITFFAYCSWSYIGSESLLSQCQYSTDILYENITSVSSQL